MQTMQGVRPINRVERTSRYDPIISVDDPIEVIRDRYEELFRELGKPTNYFPEVTREYASSNQREIPSSGPIDVLTPNSNMPLYIVGRGVPTYQN